MNPPLRTIVVPVQEILLGRDAVLQRPGQRMASGRERQTVPVVALPAAR
ncbi:MAG: hypothetical protein IPK20_18580 [Betaproteobacteria bacterium]|nr:hypothetical protein [Betaproteobacteria bacterium]